MEEKYYCKNCRGLRKHTILFEKKIRGEHEDYNYQWINIYRVIECSGCENISFAHVYGDSEMVEFINGKAEYYNETKIFPYYLENGIELGKVRLLPSSIKVIYNETIESLKSNCFILTAGGFRAIIEAICNHLKISKSDLSNRINLLHSNGYLSLNESKRLHSVRFLGNDSLHEMEVPKKEQLNIVLEILNHLLENLFIHDKIIAENFDVIIDTYEDFLKLIKRKITKNHVGKEITIKDLVGKSIRSMKRPDFQNYEKTLNSEVIAGKYDFLAISSLSTKTKDIYKIVKEPPYFIDW